MKGKKKKMCFKNKKVIKTKSDFDNFASATIHRFEMIKSSLEAWLVVEEKIHSPQNKYVEEGVVTLIEDIEDFIDTDHCNEEHCFVFDKIDALLEQVKRLKNELGRTYSYDA